MDPQESLILLRRSLADLQKAGRHVLPIARIEEYLDRLAAAPAQSPEARALEHERNLAHFEATAQSSIEMFKSVIDAGKEALKAAMLINGGAVVALLGFMGAVISKGLSNKLGLALTTPLIAFGAGVLAAGLAFGFRYISQAIYSSRHLTVGHVVNGISTLLAVISFALFAFGLYGAYQAFSHEFAL